MKKLLLIDLFLLIIYMPFVIAANQYPTGDIIFNPTNNTHNGIKNATDVCLKNGTCLGNVSVAESDPIFNASNVSIWNAINTKLNQSQADALYYPLTTNPQSYLNSSSAGYNKTAWDSAYGWGNHASAGYATSASVLLVSNNLASNKTVWDAKVGAGSANCSGNTFPQNITVSSSGITSQCGTVSTTDLNNYTSGISVTGTSTKTIQVSRNGGTNISTTFTDIDTDTDTNNYTTGISVTGTSTKTISESRNGGANISTTFTDIDTDTNNFTSGISVTGTTTKTIQESRNGGSNISTTFTDLDTNNYTTGASVTGTTTKTLQLGINGGNNVSASWTDIDTDVNNYTSSVSITGTTTKTLQVSRNGGSNVSASWTDLNTGNSTAEVRQAINNSGSYNISTTSDSFAECPGDSVLYQQNNTGNYCVDQNLSQYATDAELQSIGNWTNDKPDYNTTTENDLLYYPLNSNPNGYLTTGSNGTSNVNLTYNYPVGYNKCKNIIINNEISGTQNNFIFFLNVTYDSDMQTDFDDLRFYNGSCGSSNNLLIAELENKSDGAIATVWLKANISSGSNAFSMYYGNSSNSANWNNVNDVNDAVNYHLTNTSDSGSAGKTAIEQGTLNGNVAGIAGEAYQFNNADATLRIPNADLWKNNSNITIEIVYKSLNIAASDVLFNWVNTTSTTKGGVRISTSGDGKTSTTYYYPNASNELETSGFVRTYNNTWSVITIVYKSGAGTSNTTVDYYTNGTFTDSDSFTDQPNNYITAPSITAAFIGSTGSATWFYGLIDNVRISNTTRSNEFIYLSAQFYMNYSNIVTIGNEEDAAPNINILNTQINNNLSLSTGNTLILDDNNNGCIGNKTLISGVGQVNSTCANGQYMVLLTATSTTGTPGFTYISKGINNFSITGIMTDTSTYDWAIIKVTS